MSEHRLFSWIPIAGILLFTLWPAGSGAFQVKERQGTLGDLAFASPQLRVTETPVDSKFSQVPLPNIQAIQSMLAELGPLWSATIDLRTGRPTLIEGGAIPWIPGPANTLSWESLGNPNCRENSCIPVETVEALARKFMARCPKVFLLDGYDLVLDPNGSGPVWDSIYFLRFQPYFKGVRLAGASVYFRINNGNLIQVAVSRLGRVPTDAAPVLDANGAWQILHGYIGGAGEDTVVENGTLEYIPVTPKGMNPEVFRGKVGEMLDYDLVWQIAFQRKGTDSTWEGLVDAHTGSLLAFRDSNRYGHVHGGVRPSDGLPPEEDRPFPFADVSTACAAPWADSAGNFPGNTATSTMCGKYAHVQDACGSISRATTTGDLSFLIDNSPGTDCAVPPGNPAGAGNTHSARTLYYNCTAINLKAQTYNPANTWLHSSYVILHTNGTALCNASSGGTDINFYKHIEGQCNNLGEIPGIAMHEWGHSYDANDGSGGMTPPLETYADWTAIIQTHNSCAGAGFRVTGNCGGYGNPCTDCSGVRECDYAKHDPPTPWTSALNKSVFTCSPGSYDGPCGWEDHCESGIATQALWDFVNRDLTDASPAGPMYPNALDLTTAWMLEDRLWFTGVQTLEVMYTCSDGLTDGCAGNVLYAVMRALDDDGDGTANGTPHAHAIYHALHRHGIDCGVYDDSSPQNQNQTSCPALNTPTVSAEARNNQTLLSWTTGGVNATRYFVYRNESSCNVAFNRIAVVNTPALAYTDNGVVDGTTYYYRVQSAAANDSCVSPSSPCINVIPQPCAGSVSFDRTVYKCNDTVNVTVLDSTVGAGVTVKVWSSVDATQKTITLTNNPPGSAAYTGTFYTVPSGAGPIQVNVADGATITARFLDPDYCGVSNHFVYATAPVDCVGPAINNVQVIHISEDSATVTWTTNEPANGEVMYTESAPWLAKEDLANYVTSHSLTLTGLFPCTQYALYVTSADLAGNSVTDANGGAYYHFKTIGWTSFFLDDMEAGIHGWTASGLWHQISEPTCSPSAASPTHSWYFGVDATCTYDTGAVVSGYLKSPIIAALPAGAKLTFKYRKSSVAQYYLDYGAVLMSIDGGYSWYLIDEFYEQSSSWTDSDKYDLSAFAGYDVVVAFYFDSLDANFNNALGWMVDDVRITQPDASACPSPDGWIELDAPAYGCSSAMNITLQDSDLVASTCPAQIYSSVETNRESVTLTRVIDGTSNVFRGSFTTTAGPPVHGDGLLSVADGATITARYLDANDGHGGTNVPKTDTAAADCHLPVISNVLVTDLLPESARITWTTDEAANSRATYGTSPPPGTNQDDLTTYGTSHSVTLTGLTPCTGYLFSVTSADPVGNSTTDTNGGVYYTFDTPGRGYAMGPDDVEGGAGHWVPSGGGGSMWYISTCEAHSGSHAWRVSEADCGAGYENGIDTYLTYSSNISLGAAGHGFHLRYWEYRVTEVGYDFCRPQISTDGGTIWTTLAEYSGIEAAWAQKDFDLAAFTGSTVRIRFWFHSDSTVRYIGGWRVDDIEVSRTTACEPFILYEGHGAFTEITGDGDANYEPGEKWSVTVMLANNGAVAATNLEANLTGNGISVCSNPGSFGEIAARGTATHTYEFVVSPAFSPCGGGIAFNVIDKTCEEKSPAGPDESGAFAIANVGQPVPDWLLIQPAAADAYVDQNAPGTNKGSAETMDVQPGAGQSRRSLVQFDLSTIPSEATIIIATMELYAPVAPATYDTLATHRIAGPWTETGVTWNTLPAYSAESTWVSVGTTAGWKYFDVTSVVQGWYAGTSANYGVLVKSQSEGGSAAVRTFATREYTTPNYRPALWIYYTRPSTYDCSNVGTGTCASGPPPPVNNVGAGAAKFAKGTGQALDVTYDATTCSADRAVILYGDLGAWTGYAGCAQSDGGNTGTTTIDGSSLDNVWFNIVWVNGTTAGHAGFAFNGTTDVPRTWTASGNCGVTLDDASHSACP